MANKKVEIQTQTQNKKRYKALTDMYIHGTYHQKGSLLEIEPRVASSFVALGNLKEVDTKGSEIK